VTTSGNDIHVRWSTRVCTEVLLLQLLYYSSVFYS